MSASQASIWSAPYCTRAFVPRPATITGPPAFQVSRIATPSASRRDEGSGERITQACGCAASIEIRTLYSRCQ